MDIKKYDKKNAIKITFNSRFHKWCYGVKNIGKIVDAVTIHSLQHEVNELKRETANQRVQLKMLHEQNNKLQDYIKSEIITPMGSRVNPFKGTTFCVTGSLYKSSTNVLDNLADSKVCNIVSSLGPKVDILITGKNAGNRLHLVKNKMPNIEIWDERRLIDELKRWS